MRDNEEDGVVECSGGTADVVHADLSRLWPLPVIALDTKVGTLVGLLGNTCETIDRLF